METLNKDTAKRVIAANIADLYKDCQETVVMNLGVGIPNMVADYITNPNVYIQGENGMLGVGPLAKEGEEIENLINSGRNPVLETPGCSYFDSSEAFGMIRGGNIDVAVIGAFEVDGHGNVANWIIPNGKQLGVGGAMDLVQGANTLIISMRHLDKHGKTKLLKDCSLPLTGRQSVDYIVTEYAVFKFMGERFSCIRKSANISIEELKKITEFDFDVSDHLGVMLEA